MINRFKREYSFLSNFSPCLIEYDGDFYPSVEHAYQAAKTDNKNTRKQFQGGISAAIAKKLGRSLVLKDDWEKTKLDVMEDCLRSKFKIGTSIADKLIATGDEELIEGNTWHDNIWGICSCSECGGKGYNYLGKLLMKIRAELQLMKDPLDVVKDAYIKHMRGEHL